MTLPTRGRTLHGEHTLDADVVICGGGAGGCMAARELSRAGLDVVLLEEGDDALPHTFTQREEQMIPRLFARAGGQRTADMGILVLSGRSLGGATNHNLSLCKPVPQEILQHWTGDLGLSGLTSADLEPWLALASRDLGVTPIPAWRENETNRLFRTGVERLGWAGGRMAHNRDARCVASGFCELGCTYDAKRNARRVLVPEALAAGARIYTDAFVERVEHSGGVARGALAELRGANGRSQGSLRVRARAVCLAGSAVGSAALALRSGVPDPHERVGRGLRLHPAAVVAGLFETEVAAWRGVPQSYECTELLDFSPGSERRVWLVPSFAHPAGTAALMPGFGPSLMHNMQRYRHLAAIAVMVHDQTEGRVTLEDDRARLDYVPCDADRQQLALGARAAGRILFAAGATEVTMPAVPPLVARTERELDRITQDRFRPGDAELSAVHPLGTLPMSEDPRRGVTNSQGRFHQIRGLWAVDGSLMPTSIGVPPQLTIHALAAKVAAHVRAAL